MRPIVRSPWAAVAAAEVLVVVGLVLFLVGIARSFQFCTGSLGCDEEPAAGGDAYVFLVLAIVAIVGAPAAASYLAGWPAPGRAAIRSVIGFVGAFALTGMIFDDALVGLAVGLGVGCSLALRPTSPRAVRARAVAVALLVVLGAAERHHASAALLLVLLALPAIPVADRISR
jgi:hypothetical protein